MWEIILVLLAFVGAFCITMGLLFAALIYIADPHPQTGHHCPQCGRTWESDR